MNLVVSTVMGQAKGTDPSRKQIKSNQTKGSSLEKFFQYHRALYLKVVKNGTFFQRMEDMVSCKPSLLNKPYACRTLFFNASESQCCQQL